MAVCSLYDKKSFLNHRWKSPVCFPAEPYSLSAARALLRRAAPALSRGRTVHGTSPVLRRLNGRKDAISTRKTCQSMRQCVIGLANPYKPVGIGVVVLKGEK